MTLRKKQLEKWLPDEVLYSQHGWNDTDHNRITSGTVEHMVWTNDKNIHGRNQRLGGNKRQFRDYTDSV